MSAETEAVSGLADPGLGSGARDNAGAGSKGLDAAIAAAMGGSDETDVPLQLVQTKKAATERSTSSPETKADSEDASASPDRVEAPDASADPTKVNAQAIEAPNHWPADRKKAFAGFPPDVQKAVLALSKDLEGGYTRKSQELSDKAKLADRFSGLFDDDFRANMAQYGVDEAGAVKYLIDVEKFSRRDPVGYIRWAMQAMGVTPQRLGLSVATRQPAHQQQPHPTTGDPQVDALLADPEVAKLRSEYGQFSQQAIQAIHTLQARLDAQEREKHDYARQQHVAAHQSLQKQWTDFRSSQDDTGQLKYPHADTLMKRMGALMQEDPDIASMPEGQVKLDAAYQAALWASPNLRTSLVEQERARATAEAQKKADAEKAKRAAGVRPATGAPTMPVKKGGIDAALDGAFAKLGL